jgi:hypothetical protein
MLVLAGPGSAVRGGRPASLATFVGHWTGHTRSLTIDRGGRAAEFISSGCCDAVVNLDFRLARPRGTASDATAIATVTAVWVRDRSAFTKRGPPPRVGEHRLLRLRRGVLSEPLTGTNYCAPGVLRCGA